MAHSVCVVRKAFDTKEDGRRCCHWRAIASKAVNEKFTRNHVFFTFVGDSKVADATTIGRKFLKLEHDASARAVHVIVESCIPSKAWDDKTIVEAFGPCSDVTIMSISSDGTHEIRKL